MIQIASATLRASHVLSVLFTVVALLLSSGSRAEATAAHNDGTFTPSASAANAVVAPALRIENMTKLPGTDRGFPADNFYTFHRINTNNQGSIDVNDTNVARIHNDGSSNLVITEITTTNNVEFEIRDITIPQSGLVVAPGNFVDVTIVFISNIHPSKKVVTASLTINSNASGGTETIATLRGAYMRFPESSNEINAQQIFDCFGFKTEMGRNGDGEINVKPSSDFPTEEEIDNGSQGDMIFPIKFVQADPAQDVQIIQLSAFHSPGGAGVSFRASGNVLVGDMRYFHASSYYQTLLPKAREDETLIAGDVTPTTSLPFAVSIAGYSTIGASTTYPTNFNVLGVRIYRVIDQYGNTVPNEYILLQDYVGRGCAAGSSNCDWNDNVSYIINVRPEISPSASPIDDVTTNVQDSETYDVSGSFDKGYAGNQLTYTATLRNGSALPSWVLLDEETGLFTFSPPASADGETLDITVTATDYNLVQVSSSFTLSVNSDGVNCTVDANSDGQPKYLDCNSLSVALSGESATGIYIWTGPNSFSSSEQNPVVRIPGTYQLSTTSGTTPNTCDGVSTVRVSYDPICTPVGRTSFALEAECAAVGSGWTVVNDPTASNGSYAVRMGARSVSVPPSGPQGYVTFTVEGVEAGSFHMYARVKAADSQADSYWVRINGGGWLNWFQGIERGDEFNWNSVLDRTFNLQEGTNVIDFAYREENAGLDKIFLSKEEGLPVDFGPIAENCGAVGDTAFSLEAECARVGSGWTIVADTDASNGNYAVWNGDRAVSAAPEATAGHVVFTVNGADAGAYNLYARVRSRSEKDNSFWVKLNDGPWINWFRDITLGDDFNWNEVVGSPFNLNNGANTITFAYRETGAQLDKIYLSKTAGAPVNFGPTAQNCEDTNVTSYSLEAECGEVGDDWNIMEDSDASNGHYAVRIGTRAIGAAPAGPEGHIKFTLTDTEVGTYYMYARVRAKSEKDNSFWVRVNDGPWLEWFRDITIGPDFNWNSVLGSPFEFQEGTNTIEFGYREDGTQLDKLYLTRSFDVPEGFGPTAFGCNPDNLAQTVDREMDASTEIREDEVERATSEYEAADRLTGMPQTKASGFGTAAATPLTTETELTLYPNPANDQLNVRFISEYEGRVNVSVIDMSGRTVRALEYTKLSGEINERLDVADLAPGTYRLRLIQGNSQSIRAFIKLP